MHIDARHSALRHGLVPGVVLVLAVLVNWPLGFLAAVYAGLFAQAQGPISVRAGLGMVVEAVILMLGGYYVFTALHPYPLLFLTCVCCLVMWAFWRAIQGASFLSVLIALLAILLGAYLVEQLPALAWSVVIWLPANVALALIAGWIGFAFWPQSSTQARATQPADTDVDPQRALLRIGAITLPLVLVFFALEGTALLALIFAVTLVSMLAANPEVGPTVVRDMFLSNLVGGALSVVAYELLVIAPTPVFLVPLILIITSSIGLWGQKGWQSSALAGSALSAFVVLLGGSVGPNGTEAELKMIDRLFQISLAVGYVLVAFTLVERLLPRRISGKQLPKIL